MCFINFLCVLVSMTLLNPSSLYFFNSGSELLCICHCIGRDPTPEVKGGLQVSVLSEVG